MMSKYNTNSCQIEKIMYLQALLDSNLSPLGSSGPPSTGRCALSWFM